MKQKITRFLASTGMKMKQSGPTVLTVAGVAALIAAGVLAARATPNMGPAVERLEASMEDLAVDQDSRTMTMVDDEKNDMLTKIKIMTTFGLDVVKIYGPAAALAAGGAAAVLYSHGVMQKRQASILAAYGVLLRAHEAYRERVEKSFGPEVEEKINDGNIIVRETDPKTGVTTAKVEPYDDSSKADFRFYFGPSNKHFNEVRPEWNLVFLRNQQKFANHQLQRNGYILLNDVITSLGMDATPAGAVTGWTYDGPDGFVDFGLNEPGSPEEQDYFYFFNGEDDIVLEMNVQGLVWDQIGKKK